MRALKRGVLPQGVAQGLRIDAFDCSGVNVMEYVWVRVSYCSVMFEGVCGDVYLVGNVTGSSL